MNSAGTRERILAAALRCFLEEGYERTTIAAVRRESGVSNGALFHHFASKQAIAEALHVEAIASFQQGLWELVRSRPRSLRTAVRATIAHQMSWTEQNPDLARFVYSRGHLDWETPGGATLAALNRELAEAFREWLRPLLSSGELGVRSMLLITAIVSGPAHWIARRWLAGQLERSPSEFVPELTRAACAGLGADGGKRAPPAREPEQGRLTLELLGADGELVAMGHATAPLLAPVAPDPGSF